MAATKKAMAIAARKMELLSYISDMADKARSLSRVPDRIINGSHKDAVEWKERVENLMRSQYLTNGVGKRNSLPKLERLANTIGQQLLQVER